MHLGGQGGDAQTESCGDNDEDEVSLVANYGHLLLVTNDCFAMAVVRRPRPLRVQGGASLR